jgi:hypothetical protein
MDTNIKNVETQGTDKELTSASGVKTPLVDALRRYFVKEDTNTTHPNCDTSIEWSPV